MRRTLLAVVAGLSTTMAVVDCVGDDPANTPAPPGVDGGGGGTDATAPLPDAAEDVFVLPPRDATVERCNLDKRFGEPYPVPGLSSVSEPEENARLTSNELVAYFTCAQTDGGALDRLCRADRLATDQPFSNRTVFDVNPVGVSKTYPTITDDELTLVYAAPSGGTGQIALWQVTRANKAVAFSGGAELLVVNGGGSDYDGTPYLLGDGKVLYFTKHGGQYVIHRSERASVDTAFSPPVSTKQIQFFPTVTADELTIFHSFNPNTIPDAFSEVRRAATNLDWGQPVDAGFDQRKVVEILDGGTRNWPSWVSPDGCVLYFTSNRNGTFDIWQAVRPK